MVNCIPNTASNIYSSVAIMRALALAHMNSFAITNLIRPQKEKVKT